MLSPNKNRINILDYKEFNMPSSWRFKITLNMQDTTPEEFRIQPVEFEKADIGYNFIKHRIDNDVNIKFPFNKNLEDWIIEVLFENHSFIYARILIKTFGNEFIEPVSSSNVSGEPTNTITGDIIIGKHMTDKLNYRCAWNCYNNFSKSHIIYTEKQLPQIIDQIKEKLRIEEQRRKVFTIKKTGNKL
jgi:hypothetical protein